MKILTGRQIKDADQYTVIEDSITSLDLMERASTTLSIEIEKLIDKSKTLLFLIGKGNNGGDGLAMARILAEKEYTCEVYCLFKIETSSKECQTNFHRLPNQVTLLSGNLEIDNNTIIIDCILGTGVHGDVLDPIASIIRKVNSLSNKVISIDIPSGMKAEWNEKKDTIINADYTLTIEYPKLGMLLSDVGNFCGEIKIIPISLSKSYLSQTDTTYFYNDRTFISSLVFQKRLKFAHKNNFGHTLLICGSRNMSGAATLATGGALKSGCGLVTVHLPYSERCGVMTNCPSAMLSFDGADCFSVLPTDVNKYSSIVVGCGLGQSKMTSTTLKVLLKEVDCPMIIDADALNIVSADIDLLNLIPPKSILTPHIGELRRLIGGWKDEQDKLIKTSQLAAKIDSSIIIKGANTIICTSNGNFHFNSTGNPGMAKGGSGDVLAGFLGGLIARGYSSEKAAFIGVYLHGLAGDLAAEELGEEAMNSKDIIDYLPKAFKKIL